ncbi:MAG: VOC family protein, partial [Candidatus Rokuibacteriota bacterium]
MAADADRGDAGFTPLGLDHIVLRVRDQTVAQRFYVDVLGCTVDHVNER